MPTGSDADFRAALGARIRQLRKGRGWTLRRLGAETGLTIAFLCDLEKGKRQPSAATLVLLSDALGISIDWLVRGEEQREATDGQDHHQPEQLDVGGSEQTPA